MENYHQAPSALLCICWKDFLPQHDSKFTPQDIRQSQLEKTVAYTQALQFWVEKANLPTLDQPRLVVGSILELREAMKCYISFPNDAIFDGVALPGESLTNQLETTIPNSAQPVSTDSPIKEVAVKTAVEEAAPIGRSPEGPSTSQTPSKGPTSQPEGNTHQIDSLGGGKCYIPLGQSLLLGRSLQSPKAPDGDLIARVLGKGWLGTEGQRNSYRFKMQDQSPHCQWGCWKLYSN